MVKEKKYELKKLFNLWLIAAVVFMFAIQTVSVYSITLAEIATHNTATNCWTSINDGVYDLTSYTSGHPGGSIIASICGIDGTPLFLSQHGAGYLGIVANLRIGDLTTPVVDTTPPVISLIGSSAVTILIGGTYVDAGATAMDNINGVVAVAASGTVNTAALGTYTITYTAVDAAGNTATATRTVIVQAVPIPTPGTGEDDETEVEDESEIEDETEVHNPHSDEDDWESHHEFSGELHTEVATESRERLDWPSRFHEEDMD